MDATLSMNVGNQCSSGPHVPNGMEMVACSVGGSCNVGLLSVRPFLALTAAMSAAVVSTCANACLIRDDGRYRTLIPELVGSVFQAVVRLAVQVRVSDRVSIKISRGDITTELQLRWPCVWPAPVVMQSNSIAVGLAMVCSQPTIAWKLLRLF